MMSDIPFPGLRPFQREESDIFFGREEQSDQLLEKLAHTRFMSVVGLSGCGKSSLVRAGMIAALETGYLSNAGAQWRVATMRPGNAPLRNLAQSLLADSALGQECLGHAHSSKRGERGAPDSTQSTLEEFSGTIASHGSLGLVEILRTTPFPAHTNFLLLVDQFEEIFRYRRQGNRNEAEIFVALLLTSAEQREIPVPIYVVTTMRSDFIGDCAFFRGLPEMMSRSQFLVPRLTREQQRMAIVGPVRVFGGDIEARLVNRLLDEMGSEPDQLPVLQHSLMRMWTMKSSGVSESSEMRLTLRDYEAVGGLEHALSEHADEAFAELDEKEQVIAETMFRCLSERGTDQRDTRRPARIAEVAAVAGVSVSDVIGVVEPFRHPKRCFLTPIAAMPLDADSVLDISHESLIRQWRRMSMWVKQEADSAETYQEVVRASQRWKQGKSALWSSPDIDIALKWKEHEKPGTEWARRYAGDFELAIEFLDASAQAQEEKRLQEEHERRQKLNRLRQQLGGALLALIIMFSLTVWAFWERSGAEKARQKTQQALLEAEEAKTTAEQEKNRAEEQKQLAVEAQKNAKDAQKEAELNSSRFQEMVNTTFGFLLESEQNKEFLSWTEQNVSIEKLGPAVELMIDLSETLGEEEKAFWHKLLPNITEGQKLELWEILGTEAADKIRREDTFQIIQVVLQNAKDLTIEAVNDIYMIEVGEPISMRVDVANPHKHAIEVQWTAYRGHISPASQKTITYTAEKTGRDFVQIHIRNLETSKEIQEVINITVIQ